MQQLSNEATQTTTVGTVHINDEITAIVERLVEAVSPEKIFLFGSYARGDYNEDSDYDFYVVIHNSSMRPIEAMQRMYLVLAQDKMPRPIDILAACEDDYENRKLQFSTIEKAVYEDGVLLYER